jgi:hypothetical protein
MEAVTQEQVLAAYNEWSRLPKGESADFLKIRARQIAWEKYVELRDKLLGKKQDLQIQAPYQRRVIRRSRYLAVY